MKKKMLPQTPWMRKLTVIGLVLASGCATSNRLLIDNEASAIQIATDRAKFEMHCASPTMKVMSSEITAPPVGRGEWSHSGRQAKFVIQGEGCGKSQTFIVYCQEGDVGCTYYDNK